MCPGRRWIAAACEIAPDRSEKRGILNSLTRAGRVGSSPTREAEHAPAFPAPLERGGGEPPFQEKAAARETPDSGSRWPREASDEGRRREGPRGRWRHADTKFRYSSRLDPLAAARQDAP